MCFRSCCCLARVFLCRECVSASASRTAGSRRRGCRRRRPRARRRRRRRRRGGARATRATRATRSARPRSRRWRPAPKEQYRFALVVFLKRNSYLGLESFHSLSPIIWTIESVVKSRTRWSSDDCARTLSRVSKHSVQILPESWTLMAAWSCCSSSSLVVEGKLRPQGFARVPSLSKTQSFKKSRRHGALRLEFSRERERERAAALIESRTVVYGTPGGRRRRGPDSE